MTIPGKVVSIPVQGIENYPFKCVDVNTEEIVLIMEIQGDLITFDGTLETDRIEGTFKQHGQSFPFALKKGEKPAVDDEKTAEFLHVETELGTMYGELEIPETEGPYPVMLIIPGSGATDRNGNSKAATNNSLKYPAEELADIGIASVRYDKRGSGKNEEAIIDEEDMRFEQFVADAKSWIERLREDERFTRIGIVGHSQGSLVGTLAAQPGDVDVFVSLAGAGRSIDQVLYDQLEDQLTKDLLDESSDILTNLKEGKRTGDVSPELESIFRLSVQPFLTSWMQYDPAAEIQKLDIPVLIVNGKRDLQTPVSEAERLHEAKPEAELLLVEMMNHVLKEAPEDHSGNLETYWDPELPLADGLMEGIKAFLQKTAFIE